MDAIVTNFPRIDEQSGRPTQKEAEEEAHKILMDCYRRFAEEWMAMPVLTGPKTDGQKFPGAVYTLCIEAMSTGVDSLNLAACHSCLLLPEVSCEGMNVLLDRATLVGTPFPIV